VTVALDEHGSGEPLVLIHGLGTTRAVWRHVVGPLAAERRVLCVDVPGFGESPSLGPGFELSSVAAAVAAAAAQRTAGRFDLLGASLGGALALTLAAERPGAVRRLILSAPAGFTPRSAAVARLAGLTVEGLLRARRTIGRPLVGLPLARRALLWGAVADGAELDPADAGAMLDAPRSARRLREATATVASADLLPLLGSVPGPLGLLWGERDRVVPVATADRIRRARPGIPLLTIPGAGHVPQLERPEAWTRAVERLLSTLERG
jgi:pimeloyl-ACP methyl ester carboxylesterase